MAGPTGSPTIVRAAMVWSSMPPASRVAAPAPWRTQDAFWAVFFSRLARPRPASRPERWADAACGGRPSTPRCVVSHELDPRHAGRGTFDATFDERRTQSPFHEAGLVLWAVPDLGHDEVAVLVEARRVDLQSVGPVAGAGCRVDSERGIDGVVLLGRDAISCAGMSFLHLG